MVGSEYLWPGRFHERLHISTRQYARIVREWVTSIGLEASAYGTHSMRRTKVTQIYKKTGNLRAVQLLLGHTKMDSTVRYLGVELEDALAQVGGWLGRTAVGPEQGCHRLTGLWAVQRQHRQQCRIHRAQGHRRLARDKEQRAAQKLKVEGAGRRG